MAPHRMRPAHKAVPGQRIAQAGCRAAGPLPEPTSDALVPFSEAIASPSGKFPARGESPTPPGSLWTLFRVAPLQPDAQAVDHII